MLRKGIEDIEKASIKETEKPSLICETVCRSPRYVYFD